LKAAKKTFIVRRTMKTEFERLFQLSRAERLQLVEDLWDSIAQEDAELPVSEAKRDELVVASCGFYSIHHPVARGSK
jgi:hypothetical protein